MRHCLKGVLAATLIASGVLADTEFGATNKTFQSPRPFGTFDLARQYMGIWNMIHQVKEDGKFGGFLNITAGYFKSTNGSETGRYFGYNNKNCFKVSKNGCTVDCPDKCLPGDVDRAHLVHRSYSSGTGDLDGTFGFNFEKRRWVVQFDYYQNLDFLWKGLHLTVKLPVINEKSRTCLNAKTCTTQTICCGTSGGTKEVCIDDYFKGCIEQCCDSNCYDEGNLSGPSGGWLNDGQCKLNRLLIDECCDESKTGVGDIDVILGYDCLRGEDYALGFNFGLTIPTGNTPNSCTLYEPVVGNGGGVGFGFGFYANYMCWHNEKSSLQAHTVLDYRYFFKNSECRTLGHKNKKWAHYMLIGTKDQAGVQPFANVFTRSTDVTRGSHVNSLVGLSYNHGNFAFDLGYELFARQQERVSKKCNDNFECCFGFAGCDYNSCDPFTAGDIAGCDHNVWCCANKVSTGSSSATGEFFKDCDITGEVAETPAFASHKIYGGVAYAFKGWEYPVLLRFGGYYEFTSQKSSEGWSVFGGAGLGF